MDPPHRAEHLAHCQRKKTRLWLNKWFKVPEAASFQARVGPQSQDRDGLTCKGQAAALPPKSCSHPMGFDGSQQNTRQGSEARKTESTHLQMPQGLSSGEMIVYITLKWGVRGGYFKEPCTQHLKSCLTIKRQTEQMMCLQSVLSKVGRDHKPPPSPHFMAGPQQERGNPCRTLPRCLELLVAARAFPAC